MQGAPPGAMPISGFVPYAGQAPHGQKQVHPHKVYLSNQPVNTATAAPQEAATTTPSPPRPSFNEDDYKQVIFT